MVAMQWRAGRAIGMHRRGCGPCAEQPLTVHVCPTTQQFSPEYSSQTHFHTDLKGTWVGVCIAVLWWWGAQEAIWVSVTKSIGKMCYCRLLLKSYKPNVLLWTAAWVDLKNMVLSKNGNRMRNTKIHKLIIYAYKIIQKLTCKQNVRL